MSLILCTTISKMGYYGTGPMQLWKTGENDTLPVFSLPLVQSLVLQKQHQRPGFMGK